MKKHIQQFVVDPEDGGCCFFQILFVHHYFEKQLRSLSWVHYETMWTETGKITRDVSLGVDGMKKVKSSFFNG